MTTTPAPTEAHDCPHNWREVSESDTPCPFCAAIAQAAKECPERIWLQVEDSDGEVAPEHSEGRTWCADSMHESDVEYLRATPLLAAAPSLLEACIAALAYIPGSEVRSWPPGFALRDDALKKLRLALAAARPTGA